MKIIRGVSASEPFFASIGGKHCVFDTDVIKKLRKLSELRIDKDGYLRYRNVSFARLVFCAQHPEARDLQIDHINRDRLDNRFDNLQALDTRTHMQKTRLENASGYSKRASGYEVDMQWEGQRHFLGTFPSAAAARATWTDWHLVHNEAWLRELGLHDWMLSEHTDAVWRAEAT